MRVAVCQKSEVRSQRPEARIQKAESRIRNTESRILLGYGCPLYSLPGDNQKAGRAVEGFYLESGVGVQVVRSNRRSFRVVSCRDVRCWLLDEIRASW